jgi:2-C-methyl-D-erythritol 4-phosphate cytidylyltransferase/2-C-methyl-D-erythritol 2,4-cyclodiphosphate synthase
MRLHAIIVAAGRGLRAGAGSPKQLRLLAGKPVIAHAVDSLLGHAAVGRIQIVIHPDDAAAIARAVDGRPLPAPVFGGETRRLSVLCGLEALAGHADCRPDDFVLIHDAARPFVPAAVIDRLLTTLHSGAAGAIPVLPVVDSLVRDGETVDRAGLNRVQTPQGFGLATLLDAHRRWSGAEPTDDAAILRHFGHAVAQVQGDERLAKLTTADDFVAAEARLAATMRVRTGFGYDVHRFGPGDHLWLGGVRIPHGQGLVGHSDADVGLHAIVDALLGCIGEGDIGSHFPPSDARWRGAPSHLFLEHARDLIEARGGRIDHVDLTLVCEAPKIGPHREAMRGRIASLLRVSPASVSVKATTTEKLGFTGRGEGMAAQAITTVRVPEFLE